MLDLPGGARFVFPNAPTPFEAAPGMTFGFTWFDGWPARGASLPESRALLLEFIDELVRRYPTPPGKLIAVRVNADPGWRWPCAARLNCLCL